MSYLGANWAPAPLLNVRTRKIGGMRWVWFGRFAIAFCIKKGV